jgi:hypothetical protein
MHIPIGLKRSAGRPVKAVKGALNKQSNTKVNRRFDSNDGPPNQSNILLDKSTLKGNNSNTDI